MKDDCVLLRKKVGNMVERSHHGWINQHIWWESDATHLMYMLPSWKTGDLLRKSAFHFRHEVL